ncbi:MarR family transcriptional regulator [Cellulosimicrobium cellulans]|jgi:DNA-binding MarR family transcriptional regulator|uniref:MarR family winged helix-turn-helix transcriptional regulator n=1 Tax=Cellulosimicrobium TaxID=157920 RepID=UPI0008910111|nr:MarR family transcriptional regulator [Sphaerisporangium cinnabarinum]MCR1982680.1 MarR family transcriptional regulator [Cellulosimicrobium cellulans]PTU54740.1 MarR family transcriptional regulator [Sphaerisporangium cinnabarinum]SDF80774.1 transcriptional regulator, MarR family [Cellulosimicrobium cellulans]
MTSNDVDTPTATTVRTAAAAPTGEPRWLDTEQQRLWRAYLDGTVRFIEALGRDHEERSDVSLNEYELLVRLSESPDHTLRMSALADGLARSRSRVTHTVARMEARGLVRRSASSGDRRGVNCVMTSEGYRVLVASAPAHVAAVRRYLVDVLTPEQFRALGEAMAAVAEACKADRDT